MVWSLVLCPVGQNLLIVFRAHHLELLLLSTLVCEAISVAGKFSHCDEGHALDQGLAPLWAPLIPLTFAESPDPSFKLDIIARSSF